MRSKFFGNSKVKGPQQHKGKKVTISKSVRRNSNVRKTGRGKQVILKSEKLRLKANDIIQLVNLVYHLLIILDQDT